MASCPDGSGARVEPCISCFRADATVRSPRRLDMAHSTDDGKGTMPLLEQSFGGEAPAANFFSRARVQAAKLALVKRFLRGLTFYMSGPQRQDTLGPE